MKALRAISRRHRYFALALIVLALAMKFLVPSGFMLGGQTLHLTVQLCSEETHGAEQRTIAIPTSGSDEHDSGKSAKADGPCPFSALSMSSLGAVDLVLAITALAFILVHAMAPVPLLRLRTAAHLRPPLRGPPSKG